MTTNDWDPCPVCRTRGTKRELDGVARRATPEARRCGVCKGHGFIPARRLRALVLAGVSAARSRPVTAARRIGG